MGSGREIQGPRYYVYVSDAKVDMLLVQIPRRRLAGLAAEVTVDLKLLSMKVATRKAPETRFSRVAAVSRYLSESRLVGQIGETPYPYFEAGSLPMRWQTIRGGWNWQQDPRPSDRNRGIVFFTSAARRISTQVYLTGSVRHLLGAVPDDNLPMEQLDPSYVGQPIGSMLPPDLRDQFHRLEGLEKPKANFGQYLDYLAAQYSEACRRPVEHISFLARNLNATKLRVWGSPIWVALEVPGS